MLNRGHAIHPKQAKQRLTNLDLKPLEGPFGQEVIGVNLRSDLSPQTQADLNHALIKYQLLLFRQQSLDDSHLHQVASGFGRVRSLPGGVRDAETVFGVRHITNVDADGQLKGVHPDPFSREWHADGAWMRSPAPTSLLYSLQVPTDSGATQFADMYGGLAAFSEAELQHLKTRTVIHDVELARVFRYGRAAQTAPNPNMGQRLRAWRRLLNRLLPRAAAIHPVIRIHPESDRPAMVLGCDAWRIRGMRWDRGMRLVAALTQRSIRPECVLTHHWQPGDLLVWDNLSLLHRVTEYDLLQPRVMRQVILDSRHQDTATLR